jgi:4-amino-4-deoxy-L-arabinose transferase-like glycosyltransferase
MLQRRLWLMLILLAAFAFRVHTLGAKSLWYDELRQIEVASHPLADFPSELAKHSARPLDYWLTHYLLRAGPQEFWLRFPALLWGTLSVALMFPLARRWFDGRTALIAIALMAAAPIGVQYSQELRPYALYLLFTLISFWGLERARFWLLFALASIGGALTHYFYAYLLTAQVLFVAGLFLFLKLRWPQFAAFMVSALAGYAALFVAANPLTLTVFAGNFLGALVKVPVSSLPVDTFAAGGADKIDQAFFVKGLLPAYGGGPGAALVVFNVLAVTGLIALAFRDRRRLAISVLWLCLAPGLVILYLQYRQGFFANRYVLFALPVYLLLIARSLATLTRRLPFGGALTLAALLILLAFDFNQLEAYYRQPKDDWRRVGTFLAANVRAGDAVAAPDVQFFIRFYAPTQPGSLVDANDLGPHQEALDNAERFWFVWSDYTLVPIEETRQWVKQLPGITFELDPKVKVIFVHPGLTRAEMEAEAAQFVIPPPSVR